ncbi:MAG TPA: hypothetical protein DCL77_13575 [Prolixibacteraceae bacterium]|nr:hypothetical protein [Prolixibacteraceae bacterium]
MITAVILLAGGCNKDDSPSANTSYDLKVKDVLGVSGKVTFTETTSTTTTISIELTNAPAVSNHAYLYMLSTVEDGEVAQTLNAVDGSGKSSTVVNMAYGQLIAYDGCVRVLKSSSETNVIIAQGDIGGNVITTTNKTFTLKTVGVFGVSGSALFEKRVNGNTLVTVSVTGTISGDVYPATINLGSTASVGGGPVVKVLSNVDGTTGKSYTNIRKLDNSTLITYDNWLVYDGYINIYQAPLSAGIVISNGNIGSN